MKTIILLRHAKSSWNHPGLSDHDRPLNKRGRTAAPVIGGWLLQKGHIPDVILCSTAVRTQETVDRLGWPTYPNTFLKSELYLASASGLMKALKHTDNDAACVMLVAHQPGLAECAGLLTATSNPHCEAAFDHFPTGAAAIFHVDIAHWQALEPHRATFTDFAKPRDLVA